MRAPAHFVVRYPLLQAVRIEVTSKHDPVIIRKLSREVAQAIRKTEGSPRPGRRFVKCRPARKWLSSTAGGSTAKLLLPNHVTHREFVRHLAWCILAGWYGIGRKAADRASNALADTYSELAPIPHVDVEVPDDREDKARAALTRAETKVATLEAQLSRAKGHASKKRKAVAYYDRKFAKTLSTDEPATLSKKDFGTRMRELRGDSDEG